MGTIPDNFYVTYVDIDRDLLKIWGQRNRIGATYIERQLLQLLPEITRAPSPNPLLIRVGMFCFAKYTDDNYYRARVISGVQNEMVGVLFVDYGNKDLISISDIRLPEGSDKDVLAKMSEQAEEYYLAGVGAPPLGWTKELVSEIRRDICYEEFYFQIVAQAADQKIIEIQYRGEDYSSYLVKKQLASPLSLLVQKQMVLSYCNLVPGELQLEASLKETQKVPFTPSIPPPNMRSVGSSSPSKDGIMQSNFVKNSSGSYSFPASATQYSTPQHMSASIQHVLSNIPEASYYSSVNQLSSQVPVPDHSSLNTVNQALNPLLNNPYNPLSIVKETASYTNNNDIIQILAQQLKQYIDRDNARTEFQEEKTPHNYMNTVLEVGNTYNVLVSYIDDGPWSFSVQLLSSETELQNLMDDLLSVELIPLKPPIILGHPCIASSALYGNLCRGVIVSISRNAVKVYFVDFGNTEDLPSSSIYELPPKFFKTRALSQKFSLSGLQKVTYSDNIKRIFKEVIQEQLVMLRVTSLEVSDNNLPTCELYIREKNIKRILNEKIREMRSAIDDFPKVGDTENVVVTWIVSLQKFFVQLHKRDAELSALKKELSEVEKTGQRLTYQQLSVGFKCVCKYQNDGQWYRVVITSVDSEREIAVFYVDYGNTETVSISLLRRVQPTGLIHHMSNQAIQCSLKGFENKPFNKEMTRKLEALTLEKDFQMTIVSSEKELLCVQLYDNGKNISELLTSFSLTYFGSEGLETPSEKDGIFSSSLSTGALAKENRSFLNEDCYEKSVGKFRSDFLSSQNKEPLQLDKNRSDEWKIHGVGNRSGSKLFDFKQTTPNDELEDIDSKFRENKDRDDRDMRDPWFKETKSRDDWGMRDTRFQESRDYDDRDNRDSKFRGNRDHDDRDMRDSWFKETKSRDDWDMRDTRFKESRDHDDRYNRDLWFKETKGRDDCDEYYNDYPNFGKSRTYKQDRNLNDNGETFPDWKKSDGDQCGRERSNEWDFEGERSSYRHRDSSEGSNDSRKKFSSSTFSGSNKPRSMKRHIRRDDAAPRGSKFENRFTPIGSSDKGVITYYFSPDEFFVQSLAQETEFQQMMNDIQAYYYDKYPTKEPLEVGDIVIARFSEDKVLYRAEVLRTTPMTVQYVDYGNQEPVKPNETWLVDKQFLKLPKQVVKCRLSNIQPTGSYWPPPGSEIEKFFELTAYECTFLSVENDLFEISMKDLYSGNDIASEIIVAGFGRPLTPKLDIPEIDYSLLPNQVLKLYVSHVKSSSQFFVVLNSKGLEIIENELKTFTGNQNNLVLLNEDLRKPGALCLSTNDDVSWHRSSIIKADESKVLVQFLDRGDSVEVMSDKVMNLPDYFKVFQPQALECSLHKATSLNEDEFKEAVEYKHHLVFIVSATEKRLSVVLYNEDGQIFDFQSNSWPHTIEPVGHFPVISQGIPVIISHMDSPKDIYIQRLGDESEICKISEFLENFYLDKNSDFDIDQDCAEGTLVAAKSVFYNSWYRGRLLSSENENVEVGFIDYGSRESVPRERVKKLCSSVFNVHALSKKLSLDIEFSPDKSLDINSKMLEIAQNKMFLAYFYNNNGELMFDGLLDGERITHLLNSFGLTKLKKTDNFSGILSDQKKEAVFEPPSPVDQPENVETGGVLVCLSHIDSPKQFWVHKISQVPELQEFQNKLQESCQILPEKKDIKVGDIVAAMFSGLWYRAAVIEVGENELTIQYIDYGNTLVLDMSCNTVKEITDEFVNVPVFATLCSFKGTCKENATSEFEKTILQSNEPLSLVVLKKSKRSIVDLIQKGQSVTKILIEAGVLFEEEGSEGDFEEADEEAEETEKESEDSEEGFEETEEESEDTEEGFEETGEGFKETGKESKDTEEGFEETGKESKDTEEGFEETGEGFKETGKESKDTEEGFEETGKESKDTGEGFKEADEESEDSEEGFEETGKESKDTEEGFEETGKGFKETGKESKDTEEGFEETGEGFKETGKESEDTEEGFEETGKESKDTEEGFKEADEESEDSEEGFEETGEGFKETGKESKDTEEGFEETGEGFKETGKESEDTEEGFEETGEGFKETKKESEDTEERFEGTGKEYEELGEIFEESEEGSEEAEENFIGTEEKEKVEETDKHLINEGKERQKELFVVEEKEALEEGRLYNVYITYCCSPSDFYIHNESSTNIINKINETLADVSNLTSPSCIKRNEMYAAKFPFDGVWYRARVVRQNGNEIKVHFVDYGNDSIVTELKCLPKDLVEIPSLAENCTLIYGNNFDSWSAAACEKFSEYVEEHSLQMEIVTKTVKKLFVNLFCKNKCIVEELEALCEKDDRKDVYVSHVLSPTDFYIQYLNDEYYKLIVEKLGSGKDSEYLEDKKPGLICQACFLGDGYWYRAQILRILDDGFEVFFIDFGNVSVSKEVKKLPPEIADIPPRALRCALNLPGSNVPESVKEDFMRLLAFAPTFQARIIVPGDVNIVSLKLQGAIVEEYLSFNVEDFQNFVDCETDDGKNSETNFLNENYVNVKSNGEEAVQNQTDEEKRVGIANRGLDGFEGFKSDDEKNIEGSVSPGIVNATDNALIEEAEENDGEVVSEPSTKDDNKDCPRDDVIEEAIRFEEKNENSELVGFNTPSEPVEEEESLNPDVTERHSVKGSVEKHQQTRDWNKVHKIVPGSISRGEKEVHETVEEQFAKIKFSDKLVPGSISRGISLDSVVGKREISEESRDKEMSQSAPNTPRPNRRSVEKPFIKVDQSDRLVPGCISTETPCPSTEEILQADKIVPGSVNGSVADQ